MYYVYGNCGLDDATELHASKDLGSAVIWASRYIRDGNYGGYFKISVVAFDDDKYVCYWNRDIKAD